MMFMLNLYNERTHLLTAKTRKPLDQMVSMIGCDNINIQESLNTNYFGLFTSEPV